MAERYYILNNFSGGISDSSLFGGAGSLAEIVGCDIHSEPKIIKPAQALAKASGNIVGGFIKYAFRCSTGTIFMFDSTGTIYQRKSDGTYGTVYQDTYGEIMGAGELDDYIYWASGGTLSRLSTGTTWANAIHDWASLNTATSHQMVVNGLYLFILNNRNIATVDDTGTITVDGTPDVSLNTLPVNYTYNTVSNYGIDLLLGAKDNSGQEVAHLLRWDTVSPTWNSADDIPESSINAFIPIDNYMLVQAGGEGNLYFYNGSSLEKFKKIQGDYNNKTMKVNNASVCQFLGRAAFGVSNVSGNPCKLGVYTIGQYDRNYPMALNLEYPISRGSVSGIEIGAMVSAGTLFCVPWKEGNIYGVDELSWTQKYQSAYFKTLQVSGDRRKQKEFKEFNISYKEKPANTDISLNYYKNHSSSLGTITLIDQTEYNKMSNLNSFEAGTASFKISFTVSGNNAPSVEEFYAKWNEKEVL